MLKKCAKLRTFGSKRDIPQHVIMHVYVYITRGVYIHRISGFKCNVKLLRFTRFEKIVVKRMRFQT